MNQNNMRISEWSKNVCRLCLSRENLLCIFDTREEKGFHLKDIIFITTGVEIFKDDVVSQKICNTCRNVTVKILEFRNISNKSDKYLKDRHALRLKRKSLDIPVNSICKKLYNTESVVLHSTKIFKTLDGKENKKKEPIIHPTIKNLFKTYSNLKIPAQILYSNINPNVFMELDAVENFCKRKRLNMDEMVKLGMKSSRLSQKLCNTITNDAVPNNKKTVRPVSLKISKSDSEFKVYLKENQKRKMVLRKTYAKKVKLSPKELPPDSDMSPPTLMETLKLKPNDNIHFCHVCSSVQSSSKNLIEHTNEHLICSFCKTKFKKAKLKQNHENTCVVKHILSSNTTVKLHRIDSDKEAIAKYPFLKNIRGQDTLPSNINSTEVIDLSDGAHCLDRNEYPFFRNIKSPDTLPSNINGPEIIDLSDDDCLDNKTNNNTLMADKTSTTDPVKANAVNLPSSDNQSSSRALECPSISLRDNDNMLSNIDFTANDMEVLKQLVEKKMLVEEKKLIETGVQSEYPDNRNIKKHPKTIAARFEALKTHLYSFKVPVYIENGDFDVEYTETPPGTTKTNQCLWFDLKPIGSNISKLETSKSKIVTKSTDDRAQCNVSLSSYTSIIPSIIQSVGETNDYNLLKDCCVEENNLTKSTNPAKSDNASLDNLSELNVSMDSEKKPSSSADIISKPLIRLKKLCDLK